RSVHWRGGERVAPAATRFALRRRAPPSGVPLAAATATMSSYHSLYVTAMVGEAVAVIVTRRGTPLPRGKYRQDFRRRWRRCQSSRHSPSRKRRGGRGGVAGRLATRAQAGSSRSRSGYLGRVMKRANQSASSSLSS